ncbi:LysR substrate-binding domain-containing protein [Elongatibacter sediminis]|uniref:LysR substrate-binding domain-containing protein n=1 Tax=Elongatibacter sediminis TaxID=3119006 RepID=A0AAW9R7X5_9GAMM
MYDLPANALKVIAAVFDADGVRAAARNLRVSHSSVSRHMRVLEDWLGVELFERNSGRGRLEFSPQGKALGQAALESFEELSKAVRSLRETPHPNTVKLSTTPSMASLWLLPRLVRFREAHPGLELSLIVEQRLVDPARQETDAAIRMGKGPWPGLVCQPLMDDALFPVMSQRYWEDAGRPSEPNELRHLQLLHDRDPNTPWDLWIEKFCSVDIDTKAGPRYTSSDLVLRAASQGLGAALARSRLAEEALNVGSLIRPFGELSIHLPDAYWIVRPPGKERTAVRTVMSWLRFQAEIPGL